jgi:hypothetical protein
MLTAQFSGNSFGAPPTDDVPAFKSDKELYAWLDKVWQWMNASEQAMQRWYGTLLQGVAVGVASCAEIQKFNAEAIAFFDVQAYFMGKFRAAGAPVTESPPRPPLFASNVSVYYDNSLEREVIKANLDCLPNGYPDTTKIQILPAGWCSPRTGELNAIPVFVWVGVTAVLIGAALWLATRGGSKLIGTINETDKKALDVHMLEVAGAQDDKRASLLWRCYMARIAVLSSAENTEENRRAIMDQCRGTATTAYPNRKLPFGGGTLGTILLAGVLIGGGAIAYSVIKKRSHAA